MVSCAEKQFVFKNISPGVQPSTIYQWTHQGFIPHVKVGRLVRFREADVTKWVAERTEIGRKSRKFDVRGLGL